MKLDVGDLRLFGVDLNQLFRWWRRGLTAGPAGIILARLLKPSPTLHVVPLPDVGVLSFRQVQGRSEQEVARVIVDAQGVQGHDVDLQAALLTGVRRELLQLVVQWPAARVLRKRISLPVEAVDNLREVLGYQVGRLTPFAVEKLYYDARIIGPVDDQVEVELLAVPRDQVDPVVGQIQTLTGLTVSRLEVEGVAQVNLFGQARVASRWWQRLNGNSWLLMAIALALLAAMSAPVLRERGLVIERKQQIAALRPQVQSLLVAREALQHSLDGLGEMEARRGEVPSAVQVLAEMTRLLPDDYYLSVLDIQRDRITVNGIGPRAVELIQAINDSPMFDAAKFSAPVNRNMQTGLDQFTITASLLVPEQGAQP
ncbi:PilN domain-containing protein [Pseudomonas sp. KB-10]|uniref:PilN domain-containing protein n=1 Tax=Pseudomonas sp. KB-10 TaxID=2292264 RepID=UPI001BB04E44|nr:PilN domain-containing protein [Pseudomonas sp. KB-10]